MFLALLSAYVTALMWPQVPQVQPVSAGVLVTGLVIDAESRNPIPEAWVMLTQTAGTPSPPRATGPLQAFTDMNGQFVFEAVAPGRYQINAQKTGFAPLVDPQTLELATGQAMPNLELALKTGGAITGRIVDAGGQPVSEVTVMALRLTAGPSGQRMASTTGMAPTNNLGEFRLASLSEGSYVVIAAPRPQPPFAQSTTAAGMAPTYFPGTTDKDSAQIINVTSGETVNGLRFSMLSTPVYQVSGVVIDEKGSRLSGAMVFLMADLGHGGSGPPAMGRTDQNGTFRIGGVVSGTYRLMAGMPGLVGGGVFIGGATLGGSRAVTPPPAQTMTPAPATASAPIEVTVDNAYVTDLTIALGVRAALDLRQSQEPR